MFNLFLKKNIKKLNNRGVTLLEVLLYVVLATIILGAIVAFIFSFSSTSAKSDLIRDINKQGSFAIDSVLKEIRLADGITTPSASSTSNSLEINQGSTTVSVVLNSNKIGITRGTSSEEFVTNSSVYVSNLSFVNLSKSGTNGTIQVSFDIEDNASSSRFEFSYSESFLSSATLFGY